jgi:hypothetical protein
LRKEDLNDVQTKFSQVRAAREADSHT